MLIETPLNLLYLTGGALLVGLLAGLIISRLRNRPAARERDPRDDRIRSLEAEHRVARADASKLKVSLGERDMKLTEARQELEDHTATITDLQATVDKLRGDLKDSVIKTRQLRSELSERAEEHVRSEVKLREVETELQVAHASTDMLATGALDYTVDPEEYVGQERREYHGEERRSKAAK